MTDTGCHDALLRDSATVWNRSMTAVSPLPASDTSADSISVTVGAAPLSPAELVAVARHGAHVVVAPEALARVAAARALVEGLADDPEPHYGISTGFGALATTFIAPERRVQLQASLIRSHAAGTGPEVEREVVRALMLLRLQTLATGHTGVRPLVVETYAAMLNAGITPIVREYGSLGCSGDLAPLSHVALAASVTPSVEPVDTRTSPSPIATSAQCASGARSPEQPSEPYSRTTGVMPALRIAAYVSAVSRRTPVRPVMSVDRRSSMSARTTSRSTSAPEPAACERTRLAWSWARRSSAMKVVASAPNPVEMP